MRIAVVTPEYPPDTIGGGGIVFQALVEQYSLKHEVKVFTASDGTRSWRKGRFVDSANGGSVNRYPLIPLWQARPYLRSVVPPNGPAWFAIRRDIVDWKPQVAHLHGYGYAFIDISARVLASQQVPYILTIHGLPRTPRRANKGIRAAYRIYQRYGAGLTMKRASAITAVSRATAAATPSPRSMHVIANGINHLPRAGPEDTALIRVQSGISQDAAVIVAAGRLSESKGFDILIRALSRLGVPRLACVIAGSDGGGRDDLMRLASGARQGVSVHFPGRLTRPELGALFSIADVVAVPSRDEPFGLVALEALAMHKRVVASSVGGLAEFMSPAVAELVPPGDVEQLATAIASSLRRGPLTKHEVARVEELMRAYSWRAISSQYEELMLECAQP